MEVSVPQPSERIPTVEYLAHATAFAVVFVIAKVVLLVDLCVEAYGIWGLELLTPLSSVPGLLAADALLGLTLALVALKSGRAARLMADALLVFYLVSTHFAGLFGAYIGVGMARYVLELDHMGSSFLAELNLPVLGSMVTLVLLHRVLIERLRPPLSRRGRRPWIALGIATLLLVTLRVIPFPSRFTQFEGTPLTAAMASLLAHLGEGQPQAVASYVSTSPYPGTPVTPPEVAPPGPGPFNVVLIQMESTGTVAMVRPGADTMPVFTELKQHGIYWSDFYATVPATIKTFLSMQCGIYPAGDIRPITETNPTIPCKGVAEHFQERGYRTAFIHGGNFAFTHKLAFLANRGWEHLVDAKTLPNRRDFERQTWGIDDKAVYDYAAEWVDSSDEPFFMLISPILPHHPYETPERWETPFPATTKKDSYHNSLYFEDELIGELVDHLKATGRYEDTVFVLVGDHGQAFEEHPYNLIHAVAVYEENVRVPFLISNPRLVPRPQTVHDPAMMPDLMPTLLDLLGFGLEGYEGDGASLLDPPQDRMVYLHTTFNESMNGLRDGRYKYIHRLSTGEEELYDLVDDPGEQVDVADQHPERVQTYRELSTQWQRYSKWQAAQTR